MQGSLWKSNHMLHVIEHCALLINFGRSILSFWYASFFVTHQVKVG